MHSLDAALADARAHSLDTIIPWVEEIDGEPHVRIPEGRGYPVIVRAAGHRLPCLGRAGSGSAAGSSWRCWPSLRCSAGASFSGMMREHPERFPWTELSLSDPIGPFTGIKLAALTDEPRPLPGAAAIGRSGGNGLSHSRVPAEPPLPLHRRRPDPARRLAVRSPMRRRGLVTSCPVAAALALWERDVVQPAARRHFGSRVVRIDHAGSFSCRRLYGRAEGPFSEHATADAIDILGFRLADGRRISVLRDWRGDEAEAAFLRDVRDGACDLFSTVLSPDYNRAHADHFHFDQAERGVVRLATLPLDAANSRPSERGPRLAGAPPHSLAAARGGERTS